MKFHIFILFITSCYFITLGHEYSTKHTILKYLERPARETGFNTCTNKPEILYIVLVFIVLDSERKTKGTELHGS